MLGFLWSLASFVIALGILVAVHEWGHFWVARRCGVKVERFSVGFGKALWRRTDKLGTEYVIAAIPLGGYVKMLDERVDDVAEEDLPHAFNRQHVLKRIAIIAAGPLTNFIFAIFALFVMYLIGVQTIKPMLGEIKPDSIASQAGLIEGSIIKRVGDRGTIDWQAVNLELISYIGNDTLPLTIALPNSPVEQTKVLNLSTWQFDPDKDSAIESLGLSVYRPEVLSIVGLVAENSAAEQLGLKVGDKIQQVDGTTMANWEQIVSYVAKRPNADVVIEVLRDERVVRLSGMLGSRHDGEDEIGYLGVSPTLAPWPKGVLFTHQYGLIDAVVQASDKTWRLMTLSVEMLGKLITGDVSVKNLSGPISIAQGAGLSLIHI